MKILCTSDTHFPFRWEHYNSKGNLLFPTWDEDTVFIHAGDLMYSGFPDEWYDRLRSLNQLPYKNKLFVPGNHDLFFEQFTGPCLQEMRQAGVHCLTPTGPTHQIEGYIFGGCPFVTNLPNWAYNQTEEYIQSYLEAMGYVDVLICHSPPAGVLDEGYGVGAIRRYIKRFKPQVVICGHVHERYGFQQVDRTRVYNVAMCDRDYVQENPAVLIEVN